MQKKKAVIIFFGLVCLFGLLFGYFIFGFWGSGSVEPTAHINTVLESDNGCCMDPPCTTCDEEANEWNNFEAGSCRCAELLALGKKPCSQCQGAEGDTGNTCNINAVQGCKVDIDFDNL